MANTKISQLPSWSGTVADSRWFVMNNIGETQTFKFSGWTSQLIPGNGNNSYVTINLPRTYTPDADMIVMGSHNAASSGQYSTILGGRNNKSNNQWGTVVGGYSNTAGYISGIFNSAAVTATGNVAVMVGCEGGSLQNGTVAGIYSSYNASFQGSNENSCGMFAGFSNTMIHTGTQASAMIAGRENYWRHFDSRDPAIGAPKYAMGVLIAGYKNRIEGNTTNSSGSHAFPILIGGRENILKGAEAGDSATSGCSIFSSYNCTLAGRQLLSGIYNSSGSTTPSGKTQIVQIGTLNRTPDVDYTTNVENLHVYRTPSTQVQSELSGVTFTGSSAINLNNGSKSQLYLSGNSNIEFSNVRDGATFLLKTRTDGNYTVTWTATGYSFLFAGGIKDPGNTVTDLWRFEVFGTIIYGQRIHDFT